MAVCSVQQQVGYPQEWPPYKVTVAKREFLNNAVGANQAAVMEVS